MNVDYLENRCLGTLRLRCSDHCGTLVVDKYEWGITEESGREISYNIKMEDSANYDPNTMSNRIRRAWDALFGKRICYNDIYIDDESKILEFQNELDRLIKI